MGSLHGRRVAKHTDSDCHYYIQEFDLESHISWLRFTAAASNPYQCDYQGVHHELSASHAMRLQEIAGVQY